MILTGRIYVTTEGDLVQFKYCDGLLCFLIPGSKHSKKWNDILTLSFMVEEPQKVIPGNPDKAGLYWFYMINFEDTPIVGRRTMEGRIKLMGDPKIYGFGHIVAHSKILSGKTLWKV